MRHLIVMLAAFMLAAPFASAEDKAIAFIDVARVIDSLPEAREIQDNLQEMTRASQAELQKFKADHEQAKRDYEAARRSESQAQLSVREENIQQLVEDINIKRLASEAEMSDWAIKERHKLEMKVQEEVSKIRTEKGLQMVLNSEDAVSVDAALDITDLVISRLGGKP